MRTPDDDLVIALADFLRAERIANPDDVYQLDNHTDRAAILASPSTTARRRRTDGAPTAHRRRTDGATRNG